MRRALLLTASLLVAAACGDGGIIEPAGTQPQLSVTGAGACQGVQGVWSETGNPVTGQFSGFLTGDLEGTTQTQADVVPPGFTGQVVHGAGTHTLTLNGGGVLQLESKWVIANGRLNSSYKIVDGGRGSITAHGPFIPDNLVMRYQGSVCR